MAISKLNRQVLRLSGKGVEDWLSGLITNTIDNTINFAGLLSPQGKILADFFIINSGDTLLIDTSEKFSDNLVKRLKMYRLRAPIIIEATDLNVYALWGGVGEEGHEDPRDPRLGRRLVSSKLLDGPADYDTHRLSLGIADSHWDFESGDLFPANANMDRLNGVDFKKGCFVGQEVVSRMHRKTNIRKRLSGLMLSGPAQKGDALSLGTRTVGEVRHVNDDHAMALVRLDRLEGQDQPITVQGQPITLIP